MEQRSRLPSINAVGFLAPFGWLAGAWSDLFKAPGPCLVYGLAMAAISIALCDGIYQTNAAFWVLALTMGFVFVAPMLAMGLYEAGRTIEAGERPRLRNMLFVKSAVRRDTAYLGLALLVIYLFWGRIAQVVYGLSTFRLYKTVPEFIGFALGTPEGHTMMIVGGLVGAAIGFLVFTAVVVSAPMLLDPRWDVFMSVATSFRAMSRNTEALTLWAVLIGVLLTLSAATGFLAFIVVFPWLGLATWRAYRALVADDGVPWQPVPADASA